MSTQPQQLAYVVPSLCLTQNGSHASLLPDDELFGSEAKAARSWESYLQPAFQSVYGEPQMFSYENSGQIYKQSDGFLPNWASEVQDDPTYADMVNLDTSSPSKQSHETRVQPGGSSFGKTNGQKNFVRKLYDMLSDESAKPYIYWNSDGKSFTIENQELFAKKVLKRYLKTENFQSFIRQVNMYDFHKINRTQRAQRSVQSQTPQYVFSHAKFRRGEPELLSEIKRKGTEQQDAPPQYETLLPAGRFGLGTAPSDQPVATVQPDFQAVIFQPDFQAVIFQAEIQRLKEQLAQLQAAYGKLHTEHNSVKASLQVPITMSMPQVQGTPSSSATSFRTLYGGNASNERDCSTSAPEPAEAPVSFQEFTGITHQSNTDQATSSSPTSLESSPIAIRQRLSNAPASDITTNSQPAPHRLRGPAKPRPSSWVENVGQWLTEHLPVVHDEPGPSAPVNAFPQDARATYSTSYRRSSLGVGLSQL